MRAISGLCAASALAGAAAASSCAAGDGNGGCGLADDQLVARSFGAGCPPVRHDGAHGWLLAGPRALNLSALPPLARAFVCYDGRATASASASQRPAGLGEAEGADQGSADGAVVLIEHLLSAEEAAHLGALAERHAQRSGRWGYRFAYAAGAQYRRRRRQPARIAALHDDAVLNEVERRLADLLGAPASEEEGPLQLAVDSQQSGRRQERPVFHHDKSYALARYATVLMYLSSVEEGGETIFPALPYLPGGPAVRAEAHRRYAVAFSDLIVAEAARHKMKHNTPLVLPEDSELLGELADLCPDQTTTDLLRRRRSNATRSLAVRPVAGRAVIFWHEAVDSDEVIFDQFHGGCPVRRGLKLTAQKFKSFPARHPRCESSKWCRRRPESGWGWLGFR